MFIKAKLCQIYKIDLFPEDGTKHWEHDPKAALHSLAINSGMLRFYEIEELASITALNNTSDEKRKSTTPDWKN